MIQAIGSSSVKKGRTFAERHLAGGSSQPPPSTAVTTPSTKTRAKGGVLVMEAMWARFFSLTRPLNWAGGDPSCASKTRPWAPGLLDIGIYSLAWALLMLQDPATMINTTAGDKTTRQPRVAALQTPAAGIDTASSAIKKGKRTLCIIQGTRGYMGVEGFTSVPSSFKEYMSNADGPGISSKCQEFQRPGGGFYWEADMVALDIAAGSVESSVMPWTETFRVLELLGTMRQ
ncbi:hypothetical protein MCOR02_001099 [Pyricularia oryzae]|uniref:Gfo/Idh/MocA-like oxidoreductase C-terminal domain-containing protein n=1 Tax=Pyricularia oryzae TaxID=318829 RepID=A0A4P7NV58_PYROR|nr:hypothetical protein MCOR02_001099 [Pyricularia oryzae]KAI6318083.1 hypothetical protein MCOR34_003734 [Pyricularia oryzae]KAI6415910.1 hypothetical protein MCOR20_001285 [Pyricularia oryzae]KAI6463709.1 hypothetical protein MCOR17_005567 [Pyricularia oryzae]KAI6501412.1 hypothetical protein MCOR13_005674 [Pyricularia oryzae]